MELVSRPAETSYIRHELWLPLEWNSIFLGMGNGGLEGIIRYERLALFTREEISSITEKAIGFCEKKGIIEKGKQFISQPPSDKHIIYEFVDDLAKQLSFTREQQNALRDIYTGPVDSETGRHIYCGMPMGSECNTCGMADMLGTESPHFYPFIWTFGEDYKGCDFDFYGDMKEVDHTLSENLNANSADLTEFFSNGGKLFMYSGSADACVTFEGALNYFKGVCACSGQKNMRYFILAGQDHAAEIYKYGKAIMNGEFEIENNFQIIRKWYEEGIAPERFDIVTPNGDEKIVETIHKI